MTATLSRRPPTATGNLRRLAAASLAAVLIPLAGCAGATPSATSHASSSTEAAVPMPAGAPNDQSKTAPASGATEVTERKVARTASLTLVITDPAKSAKEVRAAAEALGGYELSENVITEQKDGYYTQSSTVTVAVPGTKLDEALDAVSKLGEARNRVVNAEDVTTSIVDLDARIKVLKASIERIQGLMAKAGSVTEIAAVERELAQRETELEQLVAQQQTLAGRVAMAPIAVTLRPATGPGTIIEPNPLLQGLEAGWAALLASLRVIITLIGALLPFAVIALAAWLPYRAWRRRHPRTPRVVAPSGYVYGNEPVVPAGPVGQPVPAPQPVVSPDAPASVASPASRSPQD